MSKYYVEARETVFYGMYVDAKNAREAEEFAINTGFRFENATNSEDFEITAIRKEPF